MVNNSTNINKANNHLSPYLTDDKKDDAMWRWKSRSWLRTGKDMWRG